MSKMWEVDPETRSKLLAIQKENGNSSCVDCNAPSPQWASPKFGIFMCLNCSGVHRGLGVHISFVRSITMDAFKPAELDRMKNGGNKPWQDFFDAHASNQLEGRTFDDSTINERYDCEAGEEWKERLTAKVEGKEYVPGPKMERPKKKAEPAMGGTRMSGGGSAAGSRSQTPVSRTRTSDIPGRASSPSLGTASLSKKAQNEAYFAKMGNENASRPGDLPPNQGGKYAGFGSDPFPERQTQGGAIPGIDDFQKDPVAALTKGFGWFSTTVQKSAKTGYEGWVKPGMEKLAEADLAAQARATALNLAQTAQQGSKAAAENFNRFVEGEGGAGSRGGNGRNAGPDEDHKDFWESFGAAPKGPSQDKKDFWDDFAAVGEQSTAAKAKPTSVGTAAMKKAGGGGTGGQKKDDDGWSDW
ncbi:ArfGap-domain-containing protein [Saccharata proteae CBS 121410]|uniref:ArfGap-domain-containing protein n=1 Tax=Saccharata proteae CBS 121410 TaxID=1314787 RepID=A0A9P4HP28_9PEZI|nr:ArfGap-domain-containing protein [Saccharata proteae CBS 121410]